MNWVDIVAIILLIAGLAWGFRVGFIRLIASLIGTIVAIVLAGRFSDDVARVFSFVPSPNGPKIVAFAVIFIVVLIAFEIVGRFLRSTARLLFVGWADTAAGALLGLVMAAFLAGTAAALI